MIRVRVDELSVFIYADRAGMGRAAAERGAKLLREALLQQETVNAVFAAAPSQNEMLEALAGETGIAWERVRAFHMDNYLGLPDTHPAQFSRFLMDRLFSKLPFASVNLLGNTAGDADRYAELIRNNPPDVCFMGVGENGHIAFNDPAFADFDDPRTVKVVDLDGVCRTQQVNDGCFAQLSDVPLQALTLTIPALFSARHIVCTVPGAAKAAAVRRMLTGDIAEECPASILRRHRDARMYLDKDSAALLLGGD